MGVKMLYRVAVVDDDPSICSRVRQFTGAFASAHGLDTSVEMYDTAEAFLDAAALQPFHLVLLDIQMPGMDGMECAMQLRKSDPNVLIIFITNMVQYAVQGYKADALDYLVKPFSDLQLEDSLHRALGRIRSTMPQTVTVRSSGGLTTVRISSIVYAEARNHTTLIHTSGTEIHCSMTLSSVETLLVPYGFFRCHAAFLVNLGMVDKVTATDAVVLGQNIPVSKHRRKEFLQAITDWWSIRL